MKRTGKTDGSFSDFWYTLLSWAMCSTSVMSALLYCPASQYSRPILILASSFFPFCPSALAFWVAASLSQSLIYGKPLLCSSLYYLNKRFPVEQIYGDSPTPVLLIYSLLCLPAAHLKYLISVTSKLVLHFSGRVRFPMPFSSVGSKTVVYTWSLYSFLKCELHVQHYGTWLTPT